MKQAVTPARREAHVLSEQKRREKINDGFEDLRSIIPEYVLLTTNHVIDTINIVTIATIDHINCSTKT
jgi:hypothetical protein